MCNLKLKFTVLLSVHWFYHFYFKDNTIQKLKRHYEFIFEMAFVKK